MSAGRSQPLETSLTFATYIKEHECAESARRVALAVFKAVRSLNQFPRRARPGRKAGTRELVLPGLPYLVVFRIREGVAEVLRILHGAQRWP
ncbi:MAG TPA: type II toxin-antitoxin system RelE/ParE family toxin [Bryobacteraceae bacterium]|nr:type II toxin-antitoxin system RelE/ParE family toxin [Bryobacteraceae bacterium]